MALLKEEGGRLDGSSRGRVEAFSGHCETSRSNVGSNLYGELGGHDGGRGLSALQAPVELEVELLLGVVHIEQEVAK